MFHRRLLLLLAVGAVVCVAILAQTAHLTLGAHQARYRQQAEQALRTSTLVPTVRGRILDRKGRVLAVDEVSRTVKVAYPVITGDWAYQQARAAAREAAQAPWSQLAQRQRDELIEQEKRAFDQQVADLWQTLTTLYQQDNPDFDREALRRRREAIQQRVQRMASHLWSIWWRQRRAELQEPVPLADVQQPIREQEQAHVLLEDVSARMYRALRGRIDQAAGREGPSVWQHVELDRQKRRRYPLETIDLTLNGTTLPGPLREDKPMRLTVEGVGMHVLGRLRDVWQSDLEGPNARPLRYETDSGEQAIDLGGYRSGDRIGGFGIEAAYEQRLRGRRGRDVRHRTDDPGQWQTLTPAADVAPEPGEDVHLTLDMQLQARIQGIMSPATGLMEVQPWHIRDEKHRDRLGQPLTGAAVVLDIETRQVLAAVSVPSMPLRLLRNKPQRIFKDPYRLPYINRPISAHYAPGSTIKPVMLTAAAGAGAYSVDEEIFCRGYLLPDHPDRYRCWIWKQYNTGHGALGPATSLERSCNVFYYTLGRRMGLKRTVDWYHRFGIERGKPVSLPSASSGRLPTPGQRPNAENDAIFMGIGQGPVAWTPLQAAQAYATLARGGDALAPTLVQPGDRKQPRRSRHLDLPPQSVGKAMRGLYLVVNGEKGTGRRLHLDDPEPIFNVEGLKVYGKSGTADAGNRWIDKNLNGQVDRGEVTQDAGDHGWFMAMVQPPDADRPTYAIAVLVEYGGSGSQVAGPIANQIIRALRAENYLPDVEPGTTSGSDQS
jgi:penicillin-binding protein 2